MVMKIEILGTGCYNCVKLEKLIGELVKELALKEVEVTRIDDERKIRQFIPIDAIPGLLIDGMLVSQRELPDRETLKQWLLQA
jgi:hypothetical protein